MEPMIVDLPNRTIHPQRTSSTGTKIGIVALPIFVVVLMLASLYGLQWAAQHSLTLGYPQPSVHVASSQSGQALLNQDVHFTAKTSGRDLTYVWDMGDRSSIVTTPDVSHIYQSHGNFTVTVTVTDPLGHSSTDSMTIAIFPPLPVASFTYNAYYYNSSYISFDASNSTADPSTSIASYNWDFGDGNTDHEPYYQNNHSYSSSGTYTVSLTVTDGTGQVSTAFTQTIVIP